VTHNDYLDWFTGGPSKHPVFGRITEGMDVVTQIENTPTGANDRPATPVQVKSLTIEEG
jgi:cyclophilin family peptidyl-prolyl cis-trans isomerase